MTASPPIRHLRPFRRMSPGRSIAPAAVLVVAVALIAAGLAGCASPTPAPSSSAPTAVVPSPSPPDLAGLLVAGGVLQVTDPAGRLVAFDGPEAGLVEVTTAPGVVAVVDVNGVVRMSGPAGAPPWQPIAGIADLKANPRLLALSPDGRSLALGRGELQAERFDLVLVNVADGQARSIDVAQGLDGPPTWVGPAAVAFHTIRADRTTGFSAIDVGTGVVTELPSYGFAIAATAGGRRIAFDDAATGEVLVGERADLNDAGLPRMTRLASRSAGSVERIALSADGRRLAIVRRMDAGASIELFVEVDGVWHAAASLTTPGDGAVSIAWRE